MTKKAKSKLKPKHPLRREPEPKQKQPNAPTKNLESLLSRAWKIFAGFAVILGVVAALKPKPTVAPSTYLDPSNPLTALFTVTNDGFLTLQNVKALCAIRNVSLVDGRIIEGASDFTSRLIDPAHVSKELTSDESDTVSCALNAINLPAPVKSADIAIVVDYSVLGVHWPVKIFPFTTESDVSGKLQWVKHPLKK